MKCKKHLPTLVIIAVLLICLACGGRLGQQKIISETFALKGTDSKNFMYCPVIVQRVYQYESNGEIIEYKNDEDYVIDYQKGMIARTPNSRIPDYTDHKVSYNSDGTFSFSNDPRNPELNVEYQILVDYVTFLSPFRKIEGKAGVGYMVSKLSRGEDVKIILCGDSIAAGAQTTGLYYFDDHIRSTFLGYLDEFIEEYYGVNCHSSLFGEQDVSSQFMVDHIDEIIAEKPDVVMVEFGMNDHAGPNALSEVGMFRDKLSTCIDRMKNERIEVILIGFFQQNEDWDMENKEATLVYNETIRSIADEYDIPFIDIFDRWNRMKIKNRIEDMTSDYMHHPTDFGHKLYFTEIMPYFLNKNIRSVPGYLF